jgi:hypothetical protein
MRQWIEANRGFWLLLTCTLIPIFFQLDRLIGAAGLIAIYAAASFYIAVALVVAGLALGPITTWTGDKSRVLLLAVLIGVAVFFIFFYNTSEGFRSTWAVIGWFAAMIGMPLILIPSLIYGILVIAIILIKLAIAFHVTLTNWLRMNAFPFTFLALLMAFAMAGMGTFYSEIEFSQAGILSTDKHQYILQGWPGWLGDPGRLILYECNPQGLWCEEVYQMDEDDEDGFRFAFEPMSLAVGEVAGEIQIRVNDVVEYTYRPQL